VKGAVCHNIKNNNFFIERKHVISGGDHGKSKGPPRGGGGPPPRGAAHRKSWKSWFSSNISKYSQIFSNILEYSQIFSNIFKYSQLFPIYFKYFLEYPRTPWIFFPGGRNIQGLLGCQAVAKACSVVALLVPDDPFCLVFSRCSQGPPPPFCEKCCSGGPRVALRSASKTL
jgi:hypothetical protein